MRRFNIRERFISNHGCGSNTYTVFSDSITVMVVDEIDDTNLFLNEYGEHELDDMFCGIGLPVACEPIHTETGEVDHLTILVGKNNENYEELSEYIDDFIKNPDPYLNSGNDILSITRMDTIFIHTYAYLFEIEIERSFIGG